MGGYYEDFKSFVIGGMAGGIAGFTTGFVCGIIGMARIVSAMSEKHDRDLAELQQKLNKSNSE